MIHSHQEQNEGRHDSNLHWQGRRKSHPWSLVTKILTLDSLCSPKMGPHMCGSPACFLLLYFLLCNPFRLLKVRQEFPNLPSEILRTGMGSGGGKNSQDVRDEKWFVKPNPRAANPTAMAVQQYIHSITHRDTNQERHHKTP